MGAGSCKSFSSRQAEVEPRIITGNHSNDDEFVEEVVCKESEIEENQMKNYDFGGSKVLIVKQNGKISALGTKCSHYGALLSTGALGNGRIRCPWHGACFNIETGDIEDYPGQDSIPCYRVKIENGQVQVRAKKIDLKANRRTKEMLVQQNDERTFVVVGGGPSGAICAETLRQNGFGGRIVMVCKEPNLPYDRTKLSKVMDMPAEKLHLRTKAFYDDNNIETLINVEAIALNISNQNIALSNGYHIKYDKIYIATGSSPRRVGIPGDDLKNVVTLRNIVDSHYINEILNSSSHVVVLGVSFIGLEAAAYCVNKVSRVTVIGRDSVPLRPIFGEAVGARVMEFFQDQNVNFIMQNGIKRCHGSDGILQSVELNDGSIIKADVCIMGIGSTLNTAFLKDSGLKINSDGSIDANDRLETSIPNVYVGGDIANSPVFANDNKLTAIGHYPLAQYHGRVAADNMCGKSNKLHVVPFFWCMVFGKSFRYCGYGKPSEVHIEGNLQDMKFVAFYLNDSGTVIAVASCQRDPVVSQFAEFLSQGRKLKKTELLTDPFGWIQNINKTNCDIINIQTFFLI
ncbi:CLUMA_CG011518, isoform A [Clunio marinus]|uniref:CLUMA_CG011518, isoform A n=1 Tax=Clunio marinus TaxID=568069 RepID=A0A1J1IGH9_9DIPT|nr:CLUMA_CG011518, isoform A [Clunio marinus]